MIEVKKLESCYKGKWCGNCNSDKDVKQISVRILMQGADSSSSMFLCETCRAELAIELVKSLGRSKK